MKAWEMELQLFSSAQPVVRQEEEQTWTDSCTTSEFYDHNLSLDWESRVPGSGAPEKIMMASIQAIENRGCKMRDEAYRLLEEGMKAYDAQDFVRLHKISAKLRGEWELAEKDESSEYWKYKQYRSFEEYEKDVVFPEAVSVDVDTEAFADKIKAAWLSQLIGGAMGTMVEGYTSENLYKTFGEVYSYLREPNTFNDDITFELAFLDAFMEKGYRITSEDIALAWAGFIPCGWSAEEIAIRNIKNGIFPPMSGIYRNPFNEWIGAQMRGGVCGLAAPGDAGTAARLAWLDGSVSHAGNGILGEVFNAVMTALAFVNDDVKDIVAQAISMIPKKSEYYKVISDAWECCHFYTDWHEALRVCMEKYKKYNWVHAYPNACCEIIALYYGSGDYRKTLHIITMCGVDVDCNAGMIMPVLAVQKGIRSIPEDLLHPVFDRIRTYMRGQYADLSLDELAQQTIKAVQNAREGYRS